MKNTFFFLLLFLSGLSHAQTFSGGSGSLTDPYKIGRINDLIELSNLNAAKAAVYWTKNYILTADLEFDLNTHAVDWNGDKIINWNSSDSLGYSPIGDNSERQRVQFTGTFNGKGHVIKNIFINRNQSFLGLFGMTIDAKLDSIGIENINIQSTPNFLLGRPGGISGGLVGSMIKRNANEASVRNSFVSGGSINIVNGIQVGGLIGYCDDGVKITNCYTSVNVTANGDVGGLIGFLNFSTVKNCYSSGKVVKLGKNVGDWAYGAFAGVIFGVSAKTENCYWDRMTSGQLYFGQILNYPENFALNSNQFSIASSFQGWDFVNTWQMGMLLSDKYIRPRLKWQEIKTNVCLNPINLSTIINNNSAKVSWLKSGNKYKLVYGLAGSIKDPNKEVFITLTDTTYTINTLISGKSYEVFIQSICDNNSFSDWVSIAFYVHSNTGNGSKNAPYIIQNKKDLISISNAPTTWNKYFIQKADIEFNKNSQLEDWNGDGIVNFNTADKLGFIPIGSTIYFSGNYNGSGHTIKNLYCNISDLDAGLFCTLTQRAVIDSLGLENINFRSNGRIGGIAGLSLGSTISNCYAQGNVSGKYPSDISSKIGGLLGEAQQTNIKNSYASVNVSGNGEAGGLIGYTYYANSIEYCYATGQVTGSNNYIGAITGFMSEAPNMKPCYWDINSSKMNYAIGSTNGNTMANAYPLKTIDFKNKDNFSGWDFSNTWIISNKVAFDTVDRPRLKWQFNNIKNIAGRVFGLNNVSLLISSKKGLQEVQTVSGKYLFTAEKGDSIIIKPQKTGYTFVPESITINNIAGDLQSLDFNTVLKINFIAQNGGTINNSNSITQLVEYNKITIPVEAIPNKGYVFIEWQNQSGKTISHENPISIKVANDSSLVASFSLITAIDFSTTNDFIVYPNPANNYIIIKNNFDNNKKSQILIYNIQGSIVMETTFLDEPINISNLNSGIYFIEMNKKKRRFIVK